MSRERIFPILKALHRAALEAVDPERAVAAALARPDVARTLRRARRLGVFAVGKAAAGMYRAVGRSHDALLVLPEGYPPPRGGAARTSIAAHPEPDRTSVRAAREAVRFFSGFGPADVILCLVSGGASSLLCLPRQGITLGAKKLAVRRLMRAGAPITDINRLRTSLSAIKGGRLGRMTKARLVTLVLSDVPGDSPALVGSGPTVRGRRGDVARVVAGNRTGLAAAAAAARRLGLSVRVVRRALSGEARRAGEYLARRVLRLSAGEALLAGGETTVTLRGAHGRGGRNLELALAAARVIEGTSGVGLLAAASDGRDGSSFAAGAFVDGRTIARAAGLNLDPDETLRRHETELFFSRVGGLLVSGPTGTNVADWVFALR